MRLAATFQFQKFVVVGGLATGLQYAILVVLVSLFSMRPTLASVIGYVVSSFFNYAANRRFTFRSERSHVNAFPRFVLVSLIGLAVNATVMWLCNEVLHQPYLACQILATLIVLVWNYNANRKWTY